MASIDDWISKTNLSDEVCSKLKEREVTLEEILEFSDAELKSFCDDMDFNSVQKVRLLKAVKLLRSDQQNEQKDEEQKYNNMDLQNDNKYKTVFVSQQENEQYGVLCNQEEKVNKLMECINNGYKSLDVECNNTINDINHYFDEYIKKLKDKQKRLLMDIDNIHKYKNIAFKQQTAESSKYFEHITKMKDDFEYFANDTSMNQKRRMIKLDSMLQEILNIDIILKPIYSPYIQISNKNMSKILNYFNKLEISYCDTPSIPIIDITTSHFNNNTFEIAWNIKEINEFESDIIGFQVYYTKINMNKIKRLKYYDDLRYDDDGNFITNKIFKIIKCGKNTLKELQKWLPSFLRKTNKGKIIKMNENDDEINDLLSNIRLNEWIKSETIKPKKRKYKMKDLEYNQIYLIKMRTLNDNGWSKFCESIMIETPPLKLTWKYNKKSNKHFNPLTDSRMQIESNKYGATFRLFVDNVLSKKRLQETIGNRFYFEFIIHKMSYSNHGTSIGFVQYPFKNDNNNNNEFALCMHFGINCIQIKYNGITTTFNLYSWPWHKTRNGDSFIFAIDLENGNNIDIYHNGIHLQHIFQQLLYQGKKINIPKKFILFASFCNNKPVQIYNYYKKKRKKKYDKKQRQIIGDIEINYLDKSDISKFRMFLRIIWYIFIPWFIRVNLKFIIFIFIIFYYMYKYRYILSWHWDTSDSSNHDIL